MFSCIGVHIVAGRIKSGELGSCVCCFGFHIAASCVFYRRQFFFLLTGRHVFQCKSIEPMEDLIINTVLSEFVDFENVVWIWSSGFGIKHWRVSIQYSMYIRAVVWWLSEFIFAHITYSESIGEALKWGWVIELRKGDLQSSSLPPSLPQRKSEKLCNEGE